MAYVEKWRKIHPSTTQPESKMETLNNLKQAAIANRQNGFFMASAATETNIGKIACIVDFTHRNANSDNKHVHARYELNGKRIAADKLQQALKA